MNNYTIFTDSACDIKPEILHEWGVELIELSFRFEGDDREYSNSDMDINEFYSKMRNGGIAKTSAVNPEAFEKAFEVILKQGNDVLYLGFSSALSTTFNSSRIAADELTERYPNQKIITIDTLAASAGQGLLVRMAVDKRNSGASVEDVAEFVEDNKLHMCHWFTVNDLVYLKRGGRVSPTVALVGKALGIKPVIHVSNEGKLISVSKARGRKTAVSALADKYCELAVNKADGTVYISHADCLDDAKELSAIIRDKTGAEVELITDVGTVIGAHAGPGTLALFFVGKER